MIRTFSLAAAGVVIVAACGGSSAGTGSGSSTPSTPSTQQSVPTPSSSSAGGLARACALLTEAQVVQLLGGASAGIPAGIEQDYAPTYKSCSWLSNPDATHPNAASLDVAYIKKGGSSEPGFSLDGNYGPPEAVSGIGDSAKFAKSGRNLQLIANKGLFSVSIASSAALTDPSLKTVMVDKAQRTFTVLGA